MKRLVVTADDFGASVAVNEAVEQAHRHGILTAASLMITGDAVADAVARAKAMPSLGVGLHVVLVEGRPALEANRIPNLVDATGRFRGNMVATAIDIAFRPSVRRQIYAEIEAQFAAFAATGLALDHVNAHKHFHVHPVIASAILAAGRRHGMRAIRAPVEPRRILSTVERVAGPDIASPWARLARGRFRRAGLTAPDQVFGLAWSGHMTIDRVCGLLDRLPDGLTELYSHPATSAYPGSAPDYDYSGELAALTDERAVAGIARNHIVTGTFADFARQ